jgi:hypothetical protein
MLIEARGSNSIMTRLHPARPSGIHPVRIACINKAKTPLDVPFDKLTEALQKCYDQYFLPVWGYPVHLYNTKKPQPRDWRLYYLDDADDDDGADGDHYLTEDGQPVGRIFVKAALDGDGTVSVTASHELFELAIDPINNIWAEATARTLYAYEMCDPVEEDTFEVDGLKMSNFVCPAWFEPFDHPKGTKFDYLGLLNKPFSMRKSGYVIIKRNGRVKEECGSRKKRARFNAEDRRGHRSTFRR